MGRRLLTTLPGWATETLRSLRTATLRVAGPADWVVRRLSGRGGLPPLWLRRHTGPLRHFEGAARSTAELIERLGILRPDDLILDMGCGCGAMALEFARTLGPEGRYVGFDVHRSSIRWCCTRFARDGRFRFELADVASPFGSASEGRVEEYRFPLPEESAGFILGKSLFTHLLEPEVRHYLCEVRRTLQPGRVALVTAFLFDPSFGTPAFPFPSGSAAVRWRVSSRPHAAVAYARPLFERMVADASLRVTSVLQGFFPGSAPVPAAQDTLLLVPR